MPWSETRPMDERLRFVEAERGEEFFCVLCARYGIQPKTGYEWLERFATEGVAGLAERSRRPHRSPTATPRESVAVLVELRGPAPELGGEEARGRARAAAPAVGDPSAVHGGGDSQARGAHSRAAAARRAGAPGATGHRHAGAERCVDGQLPVSSGPPAKRVLHEDKDLANSRSRGKGRESLENRTRNRHATVTRFCTIGEPVSQPGTAGRVIARPVPLSTPSASGATARPGLGP